MSDSKKRDFNLLRLERDRFFLTGTKSSHWKRVVAWDKSGRPGRGSGKREAGSGKGEETRKLRSVVEQCQNTKRRLFPQ